MKKILVVDDCPVVLKMMDEMLTGLNYEVTTSHDGQDAVEKVEAASST
jgi:CheY-like chemotaxis protein